jgi:hypothetical protein
MHSPTILHLLHVIWYHHCHSYWFIIDCFSFCGIGFEIIKKLSRVGNLGVQLKANVQFYAHLYSTRKSDLSPRKAIASKITSGSSRQLLISLKSGFNRLAWKIRHSPYAILTHLPYSPDLVQWLRLVSYSQRKAWMNSGGWRGLVFWVLGRDFERSGSIRIK